MKQRSRRRSIMGLLLLCVLAPTTSMAQGADPVWAQFLGDGMRLWAEGRYDLALTNLYRAHAIAPSERTYAYIIRAHDASGNCTAAEAQSAQMIADFPGALSPPLQRCVNPATLSLECSHAASKIIINDQFHTACDRELRLPGGKYDVYVPSIDFREQVILRNGERRTLDIKTRPRKWSSAPSERVPRVPADRERITVFLAGDNVYRVWVQEDAPDIRPVQAGNTICRESHGERVCQPISNAQRERLRTLIPRLD